MKRLLVTGVTLMATLASAVSVAPPAAAERVACLQPKGTPIAAASNTTPVVLVHGWAASPAHLEPLRTAIERDLGERVTVYAFDYASESFGWAADPAIAGCLAAYVQRVTQAHRRPAVIVTHSMGALATRFATSGTFVTDPLTDRQLAAVVSIHAPNLGTPIADTAFGRLALGGGSRCQVQRAPNVAPPAGCGTPPYLPAGVRHTLIATSTTFERTLFGRRVGASWDARGDGFLPMASMTAYAGSGPTPAAPEAATVVRLRCQVTTDAALATLTRTPQLPAWARTAWLHELATTQDTTNATAGARGAATMASECGHAAIVTEPRVQAAVTRAIAVAIRRS